MVRKHNKIFNGKRFALVNVVKKKPRAEKIKKILQKQGNDVRLVSVDGGIGIYRRNKRFID